MNVSQSNNINNELDQKLGVFIEHMNDQFERVIEAVQSSTDSMAKNQESIRQKLDRVADDIVMTKADVKLQNLRVDSLQRNVKILRLRSDEEQEKLDARISKLETAES